MATWPIANARLCLARSHEASRNDASARVLHAMGGAEHCEALQAAGVLPHASAVSAELEHIQQSVAADGVRGGDAEAEGEELASRHAAAQSAGEPGARRAHVAESAPGDAPGLLQQSAARVVLTVSEKDAQVRCATESWLWWR